MIVKIEEHLLKQDSIGFSEGPEILDMLLYRTFDDGDTAEKIKGTFQDPGNECSFPPPPAPPHALEERRNGIRGALLDHHIEIPDIDTQFQRTRADNTGAVLRVEHLFCQLPGGRGDRGMMDVKVPDPPGTCVHQMFCAAAAADKYQRLFAADDPDQCIDPVILLRLDNKKELLLLRGGRDLDQFCRMPSFGEPVQELIRIPGSCRKSNPLDLPSCQLVHAAEQHTEVHAAFRTSLLGRDGTLRPYVRVLNALDRRDALFYAFQPWRSDALTPLAQRPLVPVLGLSWRF